MKCKKTIIIYKNTATVSGCRNCTSNSRSSNERSLAANPIRQTRPKSHHILTWYGFPIYIMPYHFSGCTVSQKYYHHQPDFQVKLYKNVILVAACSRPWREGARNVP